MANISREDDLKDLEERTKNNGHRPHALGLRSASRAIAYNAVHGTNIQDDKVLDEYLQDKRILKSIRNRLK